MELYMIDDKTDLIQYLTKLSITDYLKYNDNQSIFDKALTLMNNPIVSKIRLKSKTGSIYIDFTSDKPDGKITHIDYPDIILKNQLSYRLN